MSKKTYSDGEKEVTVERDAAEVFGFEIPGTGSWRVRGGGEDSRHYDSKDDATAEALRRLSDD